MGAETDDLLWHITCPTRPIRAPGVTMAGLRDRGITPPSLRLIPHPAVALVLVFGGTITVEETTGRRLQGSPSDISTSSRASRSSPIRPSAGCAVNGGRAGDVSDPAGAEHDVLQGAASLLEFGCGALAEGSAMPRRVLNMRVSA